MGEGKLLLCIQSHLLQPVLVLLVGMLVVLPVLLGVMSLTW